MIIVLLVVILGLQLVSGQVLNLPRHSAAMQTAGMLERKGDFAGAIAIYKDLLSKNPRNSQAYNRLKSIYLQQNKFDAVIQLIQTHLQSLPNDLQSQIELGETYYRRGDSSQAHQIWANFEDSYSFNANAYRLLVYTYSRLSLEKEMAATIDRGRARFHDPAFLSLDLANYYHARQTYNKALEEYITYLVNTPPQKKLVTDKILLLSDELEDQSIVENILLENITRHEPLLRELLAAFYFKTGQYEAAFAQNKLLGFGAQEDFSRWLVFAKNLRLEQQYGIAIRAYETILSTNEISVPPVIIGEALLGLGNTFEDQIIPREAKLQLVQYFPENTFFEDHFFESPNLSTLSIESAFHLYDSVLVHWPATSFSAFANYRLGEIQYRITRNFDGAQRSYEAALDSRPDKRLEKSIRIRIGDLFLARGDFDRAINYFGRLQTQDINFTTRFIQSLVLAGELDSAMSMIDSTMSGLMPAADEFNDIMELRDLIQQHYLNGTAYDKNAFNSYILAERLMRQHKLSEAAQTLTYLRENFPDASIFPLALLREALINVSRNQSSSALILARQLTETDLADYGLTLVGEILERQIDDVQGALDYYHKLLEVYPGSILMEPVRRHIRIINESNKS